MKRILLVKTSSLGDVVHNLPVVSDICRHAPGVSIDWVVEEAFAAIPRMHPAVDCVIPVALRRWRRGLLHSVTWKEVCAALCLLRETEYDAIIDTQGLLKSALVTRAARGVCYGLDWSSSREPLRFLYDRTFRVPWGRHAVVRNRELAAKALGYEPPPETDYGIAAQPQVYPWLPSSRRYAVLLHATSADHKRWAESAWGSLIKHLFLNDIFSILPWGSEAERGRSERLGVIEGAMVPPTLSLNELAGLFAGAQSVIGVDTGLTHLAAALGTPTIGIYITTDSAATGLHGCARATNLGGIGAAPTVAQVIDAWTTLTA